MVQFPQICKSNRCNQEQPITKHDFFHTFPLGWFLFRASDMALSNLSKNGSSQPVIFHTMHSTLAIKRSVTSEANILVCSCGDSGSSLPIANSAIQSTDMIFSILFLSF